MFAARYQGRCATCDEQIEPGDMVRYVDDGLVHLWCLDVSLRSRRRPVVEVVCTVCFLIKPCGCEDGQ
jgi:hypothetical protein